MSVHPPPGGFPSSSGPTAPAPLGTVRWVLLALTGGMVGGLCGWVSWTMTGYQFWITAVLLPAVLGWAIGRFTRAVE